MSHALPADPAVSSNETDANRPWWKLLNRYHWFVFAMASAAWLFDCLDQQLFLIARGGAMKALLHAGEDPKLYGGFSSPPFFSGRGPGGGGFFFLPRRGPAPPRCSAFVSFLFC